MSDIVERLRLLVPSDSSGAAFDAVNEITRLRAENEKLRAALRYAIENGEGTRYWGDDDDCGTHSCCGNVSYKEHEADCWIVKARAALGGKDE